MMAFHTGTRKSSDNVNGGLIRGSIGRRPRIKDPHRRQQKYFNTINSPCNSQCLHQHQLSEDHPTNHIQNQPTLCRLNQPHRDLTNPIKTRPTPYRLSQPYTESANIIQTQLTAHRLNHSHRDSTNCTQTQPFSRRLNQSHTYSTNPTHTQPTPHRLNQPLTDSANPKLMEKFWKIGAAGDLSTIYTDPKIIPSWNLTLSFVKQYLGFKF